MDQQKLVRIDLAETSGIARRNNELMAGRFRLSYQAHRLFLYVISMVNADTDENTEYQFSVNELATAIGIDRSNLYKSMVDMLDELATTMINLPVIDGQGKQVKDRIVRVGLIKNRQEMRIAKEGLHLVVGEVSVSVYKELLPYVRELKERYTEIELKYVFRLSSSYSQKLYDLIKMRAFTGKPWRVNREELFELLAIEKGKFKLFGDFRRYVLEKAQTEINSLTDIAFKLDYISTGKAVTEIVFTLRKEGGQNVESLPGTPRHAAFKGMLDLGLDAKRAEQVLNEWWPTDPERIRWHLSEARRRKSLGKATNPIGWFMAGMKKDYRPQPGLFSGLQQKAQDVRENYLRKAGAEHVDPKLKAELDKMYQNFDVDAASH